MIQQHCYTKARCGLFLQSEGYDTVACSPGLMEPFIKARLHPFCRYQPSRTLQVLRVPAEEFPRALTLVHFPEGLMLLGQTIYRESDFSGQQSAFFTHHYVMPKPERLSSIEMGIMLYKVLFLTETEWDHLPELEDLPLYDAEVESVAPLPFDRERLQQLIYTLLEAVAGTKKVYVTLPDMAWVKPMLLWIYSQLPSDISLLLGFTTYSRELMNEKYLHLVFMDKGSFHLEDPAIAGDYVFDFDSGFFSSNLPEGLNI